MRSDGGGATALGRPLALITGASRSAGIAAGIARRLAADGWDLALTHWDVYDKRTHPESAPEDVASLATELKAAGANVFSVSANFEDPLASERLLSEVDTRMGSVRALVLAHTESADSGILDTSLASFDRHFAVNVRASWQLIVAFARQVDGGDGRIVALTSDDTVNNLPYGASKGALDRIVVAAARELSHLGISANVVNPGPIDTGWMDAETRQTLLSRQPSGRLGTPADTASLVAFLLSDDGRWINGQTIHSDGGFSV